jgi:hypothetical protein
MMALSELPQAAAKRANAARGLDFIARTLAGSAKAVASGFDAV